MYPVIQEVNGKTRNVHLVVSEGLVPTANFIEKLDLAYPGLMVVVDPSGESENSKVPLKQVLGFCNANEIRPVSINLVENGIVSFVEQNALDGSISVYTQEEERYVAAIGNDTSDVEYGTAIEALIYGWANQTGLCD